MSGKYLTYTLMILITLASAFRASAMHCLDVRFIVKSEDAYIFTFHKVSPLDEYMKRTKTWRTNGNKFQLLLSYIKPHVEVHSSTVSRCIKEIFKETGVDVDVFKGHSIRSAFSSKACQSGIFSG